MIVKLLTEHHLEFLSLKGGCRGSSESTHVKMPHCWKSHALAQMLGCLIYMCEPCHHLHEMLSWNIYVIKLIIAPYIGIPMF